MPCTTRTGQPCMLFMESMKGGRNMTEQQELGSESPFQSFGAFLSPVYEVAR